MRQRYLARRRLLARASLLETLERRSMLHAGHDHDHHHDEAVDLSIASPQYAGEGHLPASAFVAAHPELAGRDLWAPETFNPTGSDDRNDWLYDPHRLEDDLTPASQLYPSVPRATGNAGFTALPDLVPLTGGGYLTPFIDTTEIPGHNLMRFSTAVGNQGAGPAILTSANSGTPPFGSGISSWINPDGTQNVLQQIYTYDGTRFNFESYRTGGKMVWHSGHGHFHLEGYASYRLLTRNPDGTAGAVAKRTGFDGQDAVGDKIGFCLINISTSFTMPGTSTSSSTLAGYNKPGQPSTSCGFLQGIHVGRADVYDDIYDGQWIDVTGVPNGQYFLEVSMDASNVILESNEANNRVLVPVTLNASNATGGAVTPDRFEPNNTPETAANLGVLGVQTQPGLTAHISNENDYFKFVAASTGAGSVGLTISNKDVNLYLYDANLTLLGSSTSAALGTNNSPASENINYNFVAGQTYYVRAAGFGTSTDSGGTSSGYALKVNINPTLEASASTAVASESGLTAGAFTIARNGPTSSPLAVNFTVGGTAVRGVDYALYQDSVLITGNQLSIGNETSAIELQVVPLSDALVEANETVILNVGSGAYFIGGGNGSTVVLQDIPPVSTGSAFAFETEQSVSFDFSLDVGASLSPADLVLTNVTTGQVIAATAASYDAQTNRATFTFNNSLPDGSYQAVIARASLTHAQGVELGADATLSFFVLAGDVNRDGTVGFDDLLVLAQNYGQTSRTFSQGNINYDAAGEVNFDDLLIMAQRYSASGMTTSTKQVSNGRTATAERSTGRRRAVDALI